MGIPPTHSVSTTDERDDRRVAAALLLSDRWEDPCVGVNRWVGNGWRRHKPPWCGGGSQRQSNHSLSKRKNKATQ